VLNAVRGSPGSNASQLAALAAFTGRTDLATRYLVASDLRGGRDGEAVPATKSAVAALTMRAALGVCDDSLRSMPSSIVRMLASYTGANERQATVDALLERPLTLAAPCVGPAATLLVQRPAGVLMRMQRVAASGDRSGVQRMLDSLADTRRGIRPGAISIDYLVQEAWLAEFAGDRACRRAARRRADRTTDVVLVRHDGAGDGGFHRPLDGIPRGARRPAP
jgi:hypothetical protein